jgi:HEPN domain-containing protein
MTNQEKYKYWREAANEDLLTAEVMLTNGRYLYVSFMCEQALEKLAKGVYVYSFDKEAPYTHNINIVLKDIESITSLEEYPQYEILFSRLTSYYIVGRYDVYKQKIANSLNQEECEKLLSMSKEAFVWLESQVM